MPVQLLLDFSTPFKVGDEVCLSYPPNEKAVSGPVTSLNPIKVNISAIRVAFGSAEELTLKEPQDSFDIKVDHVMYTLTPCSSQDLSPFTLTCSADDDEPRLFANEDEFRQHHGC